MEQKKSPSKDYRRQSPQYFFIGLIVALSTTLLAFEYRVSIIDVVLIPDGIETFTPPDELPPITLRDPIAHPPEPKPPVPPVPSPEPIVDLVIEPERKLTEPIDPDVVVSLFEPEPLVVENTPLLIVEQMPEFPGGETPMYGFLSDHMKYPEIALDNGIEAKLFVQFIVNTDGSIAEVKVLNPQGYGFDEEAKRVIRAMPNWKPGKQGGRKVRVYFVIPINFALK
ncbi:MAG: protein TonB [Salibacteraceae bacterium]|jgi:protein TonB